jgi:hypothetical protein
LRNFDKLGLQDIGDAINYYNSKSSDLDSRRKQREGKGCDLSANRTRCDRFKVLSARLYLLTSAIQTQRGEEAADSSEHTKKAAQAVGMAKRKLDGLVTHFPFTDALKRGDWKNGVDDCLQYWESYPVKRRCPNPGHKRGRASSSVSAGPMNGKSSFGGKKPRVQQPVSAEAPGCNGSYQYGTDDADDGHDSDQDGSGTEEVGGAKDVCHEDTGHDSDSSDSDSSDSDGSDSDGSDSDMDIRPPVYPRPPTPPPPSPSVVVPRKGFGKYPRCKVARKAVPYKGNAFAGSDSEEADSSDESDGDGDSDGVDTQLESGTLAISAHIPMSRKPNTETDDVDAAESTLDADTNITEFYDSMVTPPPPPSSSSPAVHPVQVPDEAGGRQLCPDSSAMNANLTGKIPLDGDLPNISDEDMAGLCGNFCEPDGVASGLEEDEYDVEECD